MDIIKQIECCEKRLDNGELVYGAYVPDYALDNPNESGCIVDNEYGIQYLVDPKTVKLVRELEKEKMIDGQGDSAEMKEIFEELQISGRSDDLFLIDFSKQNKE